MGIFRTWAESFFNQEEDKAIVQAIAEAEMNTSGEIRVHLHRKSSNKDILKRAAKIFHKLGMDRTELRNGVLIYLAVADHRFAIYADQGINERVPDGFWNEVAALMEKHFKEKHFVEGLTQGITMIGQQLKSYFPRAEDDENELPDEISYS